MSGAFADNSKKTFPGTFSFTFQKSSRGFVLYLDLCHDRDPDLFLSFDIETPTGANYTFMQEEVGADVFEIGRYSELFCGSLGADAACHFRVGVVGYEDTDFMIEVLATDRDGFKAQGKAAEAEPLAREAVATSLDVLGAGHPFALVARVQLASVLRTIGGAANMAEAEELNAMPAQAQEA